jgi:hypothetical protein
MTMIRPIVNLVMINTVKGRSAKDDMFWPVATYYICTLPVVTVAGFVASAAPSILTLRRAIGMKSVALIVTPCPTGPLLGVRVMPRAALAGTAAIATRPNSIAITANRLTILVNFIDI